MNRIEFLRQIAPLDVVVVGTKPYRPGEIAAALDVTDVTVIPADADAVQRDPAASVEVSSHELAGRGQGADGASGGGQRSDPRARRCPRRRSRSRRRTVIVTEESDLLDRVEVQRLARWSVSSWPTIASPRGAAGSGGLDPADERQLGRRLIARQLDELASSLLGRGDEPVDDPRPRTHSRTPCSMPCSDSAGSNRCSTTTRCNDIHIRGCEPVWLKLRDGTPAPRAPVVGTDDELVELIRRAAARGGSRRAPLRRRHARAEPPASRRLAAVRRDRGVGPTERRSSGGTGSSCRRSTSSARGGMFDGAMLQFLAAAVRARRNIVLSGGTGTGKTTLLRALINEIPTDERLVTIEDAYELGIDRFADRHPDHDMLQSRPGEHRGPGRGDVARPDAHGAADGSRSRDRRRGPGRRGLPDVAGDEPGQQRLDVHDARRLDPVGVPEAGGLRLDGGHRPARSRSSTCCSRTRCTSSCTSRSSTACAASSASAKWWTPRAGSIISNEVFARSAEGVADRGSAVAGRVCAAVRAAWVRRKGASSVGCMGVEVSGLLLAICGGGAGCGLSLIVFGREVDARLRFARCRRSPVAGTDRTARRQGDLRPRCRDGGCAPHEVAGRGGGGGNRGIRAPQHSPRRRSSSTRDRPCGGHRFVDGTTARHPVGGERTGTRDHSRRSTRAGSAERPGGAAGGTAPVRATRRRAA